MMSNKKKKTDYNDDDKKKQNKTNWRIKMEKKNDDVNYLTSFNV